MTKAEPEQAPELANVEPSPEPAPEPEPVRTMLGVRGFWCYEETSGDDAGWGWCLRREPLCRTTREKERKKGAQVTACTFTERARCFSLVNQVKQLMVYRCVDLAADCEDARTAFAAKYPDTLISECEVTE